jgi:hypothetical protein
VDHAPRDARVRESVYRDDSLEQGRELSGPGHGPVHRYPLKVVTGSVQWHSDELCLDVNHCPSDGATLVADRDVDGESHHRITVLVLS